jgi:hypothetical protein
LVVLSFLRAAEAADFPVLTTADSGPGSLRQAILDANATPGADRVVFAIPGTGVQVISVGSSLPQVTESLIIDGYTQPGAKPNSLQIGDDAVLLIQLDGSLLPPSSPNGIEILASNSVVRGLVFTHFLAQTPFGMVNGAGIVVREGNGNAIEGCFVGIAPDGQTPGANGHGIDIYSSAGTGTVVGGTSPDKRNLISGNAETGLFVGADGTSVLGNYVGTDSTGTRAVSNLTGIHFNGPYANALIGGTVAGAGNLVSGNSIGIGLGAASNRLLAGTASGVVVQGNLVGTSANGEDAIANVQGITIDGSQNVIGGIAAGAGNVIAFNGIGVTVEDGTGNRILSNAIYSSSRFGISLGASGRVVPNDVGDGDSGPNNNQNFPVIQSVAIVGSSATINGALNSTPTTTFTIQFFTESQATTDSRQSYIGGTMVTTDANGDATFSVTLPVPASNVIINATATSAGGDTSEFFLNSEHFRNISTRARVDKGNNVLIGGFILNSPTVTHVVLRALGPSLSTQMMSGYLEDPVLELYRGSTLLLQNDNWADDAGSAGRLAEDGLAPHFPSEAALDTFLDPGSYTVIVRGKNQTTGVAVVEMYDLSDSDRGIVAGNTANVSSRALVETGDNIMIGGIILRGGNLPALVVARGIGPSLVTAGIPNALTDPTLELRDQNGLLIASNDDWKQTQEADLLAIGLAPRNDKESAIVIRLPAGAYTAILRGKSGGTGVGVVEMFNVP